jgi:hypothetical protein
MVLLEETVAVIPLAVPVSPQHACMLAILHNPNPARPAAVIPFAVPVSPQHACMLAILHNPHPARPVAVPPLAFPVSPQHVAPAGAGTNASETLRGNLGVGVGVLYSITTFIRAITSLLQIRQVAHLMEHDMQPLPARGARDPRHGAWRTLPRTAGRCAFKAFKAHSGSLSRMQEHRSTGARERVLGVAGTSCGSAAWRRVDGVADGKPFARYPCAHTSIEKCGFQGSLCTLSVHFVCARCLCTLSVHSGCFHTG